MNAKINKTTVSNELLVKEGLYSLQRGGKQVRVKRPSTIDGIPEDEWIEKNADPIWLHQNEMWDVLDAQESKVNKESEN